MKVVLDQEVFIISIQNKLFKAHSININNTNIKIHLVINLLYTKKTNECNWGKVKLQNLCIGHLPMQYLKRNKHKSKGRKQKTKIYKTICLGWFLLMKI